MGKARFEIWSTIFRRPYGTGAVVSTVFPTPRRGANNLCAYGALAGYICAYGALAGYICAYGAPAGYICTYGALAG